MRAREAFVKEMQRRENEGERRHCEKLHRPQPSPCDRGMFFLISFISAFRDCTILEILTLKKFRILCVCEETREIKCI